MGVYTRFKKNPDGFRKIVELIETTPPSRRQKMIDVGMQEDPAYTEKILQYTLNFNDIVELSDLELSEVLAHAPAMLIAYAIHKVDLPIQQRFLARSTPIAAAEIKEYLETPNITPIQIGAGQTKLIEVTRILERKGILTTKRIPPQI